MRIAAMLAERQVDFESLPHPPAFTAQKRAKYLRVSGRRVAKGVLLHGPDGFLLAVLPASHRIDTARLGLALGGPVRLATSAEIRTTFPDCEWGVVPPFGRLYDLPTVLDDSLPLEALIVFETHTHLEAVRFRCDDYERLERPRRLAFASPASGVASAPRGRIQRLDVSRGADAAPLANSSASFVAR
jgi:Ala-tRNA(Pro) deacylase